MLEVIPSQNVAYCLKCSQIFLTNYLCYLTHFNTSYSILIKKILRNFFCNFPKLIFDKYTHLSHSHASPKNIVIPTSKYTYIHNIKI